MSLHEIAIDVVAMSCPLRWFVLAFCIAMPSEAAMVTKVICSEFMCVRFSYISFPPFLPASFCPGMRHWKLVQQTY
jgi:hypothetical protein